MQKLVTNDDDVFPMKYNREFPSSFEPLVKTHKYLFHVLVHTYSSQFKETLALELHRCFNTFYIHFILLTREFNLLSPQKTTIMNHLKEVLCSGEAQGTEPCAGEVNTTSPSLLKPWLGSCAHVQRGVTHACVHTCWAWSS